MKKIIIAFMIILGFTACSPIKIAIDKPWILSYQIDNYDPTDTISSFSKNRKKANSIVILTFINKDSIQAKNYPVGSQKQNFSVKKHFYYVQKKEVTFRSESGSESTAKYIVNNDSLILVFTDKTKYIYHKLDIYNQHKNKSKIEKMITGNKFTLINPEGKKAEDINFLNNYNAIISYKKIDKSLPKFYWTLDEYKDELFLVLSRKEPFESSSRSRIDVFQITKFDNQKIFIKSYKWREKVFTLERIIKINDKRQHITKYKNNKG